MSLVQGDVGKGVLRLNGRVDRQLAGAAHYPFCASSGL